MRLNFITFSLMSRKSSYSFYIDDAMRERLKQASESTAISQAEIVRQAIAKELDRILKGKR